MMLLPLDDFSTLSHVSNFATCADCGVKFKEGYTTGGADYCSICAIIRQEDIDRISDIIAGDIIDETDDDIAIGTCWCGAYGNPKTIHYRMIDGRMEECGEYL